PLGLSSGLPFGLAFPTLSDLSDPISSVLSGVFRFRAFPFRPLRLYQKFRAGLTGNSFSDLSGVLLRHRRSPMF
ncbi:hypothetical protein ABZ682_23715, partial [Streptomyces griseoviridis]|uniref:hypothetical protein n=1 Tax=Streptomyces griseoviridis TaxID=45398 RepID=UPI003400572D